MRKLTRSILVTVAAVLLTVRSVVDALAWGPKGHRLVGLIARELLTDDARREIKTITQTGSLALAVVVSYYAEKIDAAQKTTLKYKCRLPDEAGLAERRC